MPTVEFTDDEAEAVLAAVDSSLIAAPEVKELYMSCKVIEDAQTLVNVARTHDDYVDSLKSAKDKLEEVTE